MFPASQMYNKFDFIPLVEQHVSPYGSSATGCWNVGKKSQLKLKTPYYYYLLCYCRPATAHAHTGWTLPHDGRGAALVHIFPWHSTHSAPSSHTLASSDGPGVWYGAALPCRGESWRGRVLSLETLHYSTVWSSFRHSGMRDTREGRYEVE